MIFIKCYEEGGYYKVLTPAVLSKWDLVHIKEKLIKRVIINIELTCHYAVLDGQSFNGDR